MSFHYLRAKSSDMRRLLSALLGCFFALFALSAQADDANPSAMPKMRVTYGETIGEEVSEYIGNAPMTAEFTANPQTIGNYTPLYEWRFTKVGESKPFLLRHEENTTYVFRESGSFTVNLLISFVQGTDTIEYSMDEPFKITISESRLEVPNAFTPNGDGINDVFKVKDGYQSIVSFRAIIFNRWGKKLYEWTDLKGGWDGRAGGSDAPDGAYYLNLQAKGADGRNYNIKRTINLLRGFDENTPVAP